MCPPLHFLRNCLRGAAFILALMQKPWGELALIERIRSHWAGEPASSIALGIGDDCAILRPPKGHEVLVTTDFSLENRHFRRATHPAHSVGHRVLARGLSDLAAMGARPLAAFLSLALPANMPATAAGRRWVEQFFAGLHALAQAHSVPLAGGDTAQSPSGLVLADIVLLGSAPTGRSLRRSGARPGDALYVTGSLGGSAAELSALLHAKRVRKSRSAPADHPHLYPQPRLAIGSALLRRSLATAAIDLSDGLSTDLAHLCQESHVSAEISAAALPIHPLAAAEKDPAHALSLALHGGEDYELLFTASPAARIPSRIAGVPITRIGRILQRSHKPRINLIDAAGRRAPLAPAGWEHFAAK